jgi:hypothetical protein
MSNARIGPEYSGYFWVCRDDGFWDVAAWDRTDQSWMVLGYEDCVTTKAARIVEWRVLDEPGPTELRRHRH